MSYTIVIRSENASSRSAVAAEANSDFSVNIPAVIPEDNTSQRFAMTLKSVAIDTTDVPAALFEVHVDASSAMNFYDTKTNSASTLAGVCAVSIATDGVSLYYPYAQLISSISKVVTNPNYSTIRVRYVTLAAAPATVTKTGAAALDPNLIVLEFTPL